MATGYRQILCLLILQILSLVACDPAPGGLIIEESCRPYAATILSALDTALDIANRGISEARGDRSYTFLTLFRQPDRERVQKVYEHVSSAIRGVGKPISLTCVDSVDCRKRRTVLAYNTNAQLLGRQPRINLCTRVWDHDFFAVRPDYCVADVYWAENTNKRKRINGWAISLTLLHELLHVRMLTDGMPILDHAYDYDKCRALAQGELKLTTMVDGAMVPVGPADNAENYIFMPLGSMRIEMLALGACGFDRDRGMSSRTDPQGNGQRATLQGIMDRSELRRSVLAVIDRKSSPFG